MKKQEAQELYRHRYGPDKPMSGAQLDAQFFTPIPMAPPSEHKALGPTISVNTGPALKPRKRDPGICADCGGTGLKVVSVSSVGTKRYGQCKH